MRSQRRLELRVGLFLTSAMALTLFVIWMLGSAQNLFSRHDPYSISVPDAAGITPGAKVTISGVDAGLVDSFSLNSTDRNVRINLNISSQFEDSIRQDSFAEIVTQGVLGDKLIAIASGTRDLPKLSRGAEIPVHLGASLQTLLGKGDDLASSLSILTKDLDQLVGQFNRQFRGDHLSGALTKLESVLGQVDRQVKGDHLEHSLSELDSILGKLDQGSGTLGELLNDPKLYDDVKSLVGETNQNRIVRNLIRKSLHDAEERKKEYGSN